MKSFVKILHAFGDTSSIHGIQYALGSNHRTHERSVWTIVVLIGVMMSLVWSYSLFQSKAEDPTMTTIESTALPISNISFPVISVCRPGYSLKRLMEQLGKMGATVNDPQYRQREAIQLLQQNFESWPNLTADLFASHMISSWKSINLLNQIVDYPDAIPLELMLNKSKTDSLRSEERKKGYSALGKMLQIERNYPKVLKMLLGSAFPCHEFIKHCKWNGKNYPCQKLFVFNPTDAGLCCSFYMDLRAVKEDVPFIKTLFVSDLIPSSVLMKGNEDLLGIDMTPKTGFGLELILDVNSQNNDPGSVRFDHHGIQSSISSHSESVSMSTGAFLIAPGQETFVSLTAMKVDTEKKLEDTVEPASRKCYFPHEYQLVLYKEYSRARCHIECRLKATFEAYNCTPWFLPWTTQSICDPEKAFEVTKSSMESTQECFHCLDDCNEVTYDYKMSSAPFRRCDDKNMESSFLCSSGIDLQPQKWAHTAIEEVGEEVAAKFNLTTSKRHLPNDKLFPNTFKEASKDNEYDAFEKDISVVKYSFGKSTIVHYRKRTRTSDTDLLAQVGGIFGLCLGCSFISVFEVLYWFIMKFLRF